MWWTELAEESWDALFEPHHRMAMVLRAREVLDEVEFQSRTAWAAAEPVALAGVVRKIRRTLIEAGTPGLWIYWSLDADKGAIVLDFVFAD
ncbi:hypothetical protein [Mycolicibacterium lutetiense]|uniref:Uncharacterized protein n=1 Tax=Mycolicibacterium lutetiense TaxID=1641992 RepID=A0ABS4ZS35_9MYCO|nr:hypothetical protein [Mycolicibacterium lutetiense]MBP2452310.1 hypothetical protein [Mycolicibacterium lutetiense]